MEDKSTNELMSEEQLVVKEEMREEGLEGDGKALPEKEILQGQNEEGIAEDEKVDNAEEEEAVGNQEDLQANEEEQPDEEDGEDNNEQYNEEEGEQEQYEVEEEAEEETEPHQEELQGPSSTIHETLYTPVMACNCCNHLAGSEIFCQQADYPEPESEYEQQSQSQIEHIYQEQQPAQEWRDDELVIRKDGYGFLEQEYDFVVGQVQEEMIDEAEREVIEEKHEEKENLEMAVQVEIAEPVIEHEVKEAATQSAKPITMKSAPPTSQVPKGQEARLVEETKIESVVKNEEVKQAEEAQKEISPLEVPQPVASNIQQIENPTVIKTEIKQQPKKVVDKPQEKPAEKPKLKKKVKKEGKDPNSKKSIETKNVQTSKATEQPINPPIIAQAKVEKTQPQVKALPKEEIKPITPIPILPVKVEVQKPEQKKYEVKVVEKNAFKSTKKVDEPIDEDEPPIKNEEVPHQAPNHALLLRNKMHQAELQKKERQEPPTAEQLIQPKQDEQKVEVEQPKPKIEREQPHSKIGPAKKKKKKKTVPSQAPKINEQPNKIPASQAPSKPQDSRRSSNLNSQLDHLDKASMLHESRDPSQPSHPSQRILVNMISPELIAAESQSKLPILTSLIVVKQAEKERVGTTYKMFLKYNYEYERTVNNYRRIVDDVCNELSKKKESKRPLQRILEDYFQDFCKQCREYNQRCYKIEIQDQVVNQTNNKFANIRLEMKKGFDEMVYLRKSIANNSHRLNGYVTTTVLTHIRKAFEVYHSLISQEQAKQKQRREDYYRRAKIFNKTLAQVDKNFNKGLQGKVKDDLFIEITRFINEEKIHRVALRTFGRGLIDLRSTFIKCEKELFDSLQDTINKFKTQSKAIYCFGPSIFDVLQDYSQEIKTSTRFLQLCTLTDLDYIKYVLQIQSKKETNQFSNRNFESYLDLVFFDRVVGNIRDTLKGATNKSFPMENPSEELIHSISGNLVLFSREHDLCKDKYEIKNLNAKIIGAGFVEFDELLKGVIFDDNRTIRLKLKDQDRVQQLICYLNEKEEDILLDHGRRV